MPRFLLASSLAAASAASVALAADPVRTLSPQEVPAGLAPAVERGDAAADALRDRFLKRVTAMLAQGGPTAAMSVCPTEAPRIARDVAEVHHVDIGRTSFRLRNPANAPRAWAASYVAAAAGKRPDELKPVVFDLGDRVGLLRPIVATPTCKGCHGPAEVLDPQAKAEIVRRYPRDQAIGFAPGDLRGFIWVEVKKR
ncbi:MAG TPA: DUF3365 domain-containing protein [Anaeromyxobacter sp.]|nr:DUF3365 domain-containing protein [Anaeromyxobacter sp.]